MGNKTTPHINIHDALKLDGDPESILRYYRTWAETYDDDVIQNYYGVALICDLMHEYISSASEDFPAKTDSLKIVDVGCGTGLLGPVLHKLGYANVDGIDLSADMIEKARSGGYYQSLFAGVNLNEPLPGQFSGKYNVAICLGVFTPGHVLPEALRQLAALTRSRGLVVTSTRTSYCDSTNYEKTSDALQAEGLVNLLACRRDAPYRDDGDAHYWIYQVC